MFIKQVFEAYKIVRIAIVRMQSFKNEDAIVQMHMFKWY